MRPGRRAGRARAAAAILAFASAGLALGCQERARPPGIVTVLVSGAGGISDSATGFLAGDRRVVTVAHVLDSGGTVSVRGAGGRLRTARVLRTTRRDDLALLALDGGITAFEAPPARGTRLLSAHKGRLTAVAADVRRRIRARVADPAGSPTYARSALELAAEVTGGDSGSPVIDADGRLLGVVFARSERRPGIAYATDAAAVASLLGKPARSAQQTPRMSRVGVEAVSQLDDARGRGAVKRPDRSRSTDGQLRRR